MPVRLAKRERGKKKEEKEKRGEEEEGEDEKKESTAAHGQELAETRACALLKGT